MRLFFAALAIGLFSISSAWAQAVSDAEEMAVYSEVCEKVNPEESKTSARLRATEKASFKAVDDIPDLERYRSQMDTHNFNLKIYRLIDNYLEDIKTAVTQQTDNLVCVEVNAFLPEEALFEVFEGQEPETQTPEEDQQILSLEVENVEDDVNIAIPPKPDIVINNEIAYDAEVSVPVTSGKDGTVLPAVEVYDLRTKVFVDKTDFYDGTDTNGFFPALEQILKTKKGIRVTAERGNPDYILKTKILKAKVDNINAETGRLQIVVAADLIDTASSEVMTEHLNKFELFNLSDDPQKKASSLSIKSFDEVIQKLLPYIKTRTEDEQGLPSVITPN